MQTITNEKINEKVREAAKCNLAFFSEYVLGYKNAPHHNEWYSVLQDSTNRKIVILAPRNHAKSTCLSINYPLWEMWRNPEIRIVIISNTASQASSFLRAIKFVIERDDKYKRIVGELKPRYPEKWTDNEIIINRYTKEKDPTISTVGTGGAILSKRADLILADDILNKDNTRTPEQRQKVEEWWKDVVMPVLEPNHGRIIWISTAFSSEDLSQKLLADPTFDYRKVFRAIERESDNKELWEKYREILFHSGKEEANRFYEANKKEMLSGSKVLWEERWSYKRLCDERISSGVRSFNLMYQNDPVNDETAVFRESWIEQCKDTKRRLLDTFQQSTYDMQIMVITQGVDLAISEDELANETVITTLAKNGDNKFVILNAVGGHWSPSETRANIKGQNDRFNPALILVENNAFQASMVKDLQSTSTAPIKGFTTGGEKFDEFVGINSLAVAMENGQFIIPADPSHGRTIDYYERIKHEMMSFPSGHTGDWLMSLWFAFTALRSITSNEVYRVTATNVKPDVEY